MANELPHPGDPHPPSKGNVDGTERMLELARRVTKASGRPVVGGIAVVLHGWGRFTRDIDIYSDNFRETHDRLVAAGIPWDAKGREFLIEGVAVHLVPDDSLGGPPKRISTIKGVKVIGLADLIRGKLTVGLVSMNLAKDLADVVELIRLVPLKKDFAPKLPKHLRAPFKALVDDVHEPRRTPMPPRTFWKKYAT
jgi:hypothetical protein